MDDQPPDLDIPASIARDPWVRELHDLVSGLNETVDGVIVEGPNDVEALRRIGVDVPIHTCAQTDGLVAFASSLRGKDLAILTDYDQAGKELNGRLRDLLGDGQVDPTWRRAFGLVLTQEGHYEIESLNRAVPERRRGIRRDRGL